MNPNPVPAACVVVADGRQQVLLVESNAETKTGRWCLPGGFMQLGESPEQAALRELKSKTGLSGQIELLLGVVAHPGETVAAVLTVGYLVCRTGGKTMDGNDAYRLSWFHPERLPPIAFQSHRQFIRLYYAAYADG